MGNQIKASDLYYDDGAIKQGISDLKELTGLIEDINKKSDGLKTQSKQLEQQIDNTNAARKEEYDQIKKNAEEAERLKKAEENYKRSLGETQTKINQLKDVQKSLLKQKQLEEKVNKSAAGSYDQLSAKYSLIKIRLNAMSEAQRMNTKAGKEMEAQSAKIYAQMTKLQEATGKHTLSVGNYGKAYNGLTTQVNFLTRELPVLGMNMNTFFLAISNNVPMFVDELSNLKKANEALVKQGKSIVPVGRQLAKAILSWQTLLSVGVALLVIYGEKMVKMIGSLLKGKKATDGMAKAQEQLNEAYEEGSVSAQSEIVKLDILYKATQDHTKSRKEQTEAIKQLKSEWPEYFKNLTDEEILAGKASYTYKLLAQSILAVAKAKAIEQKLVTNYEEIIKLQDKLNDKYEKYNDMISEGPGKAYLAYTTTAKGVNSLIREINALNKANDELIKQINVEDLFGDPEKSGKETKNAKDNTIKYLRQWYQTNVELIDDAQERELQSVRLKYDNEINDLKDKLNNEKGLTAEGREAIIDIITNKEKLLKNELIAIERDYQNKRDELREKEFDKERKRLQEEYKMQLDYIDQEYDLRMSEIDILDVTENKKTRLRLKAEKDRLKKILELNENSLGDLSTLEIDTIQNTITKIDQEISEADSFWNKLSLNDEQKSALRDSVQYAVDQYSWYLDERKRLADEAVAASEKEVASAETALDNQIRLAEVGYAANIGDAQRNLDLAKATQEKALAEQEKAQKAQARLDTLEQASSLITASANIWSTFSKLPIIGIPLAIAAIATMFGSFIGSKVKANQIARSEKGSYEILEGGSHAGNHDISLGINSSGKERRAEGGEGMAIFSRGATKKYKGILPGLVQSINTGTFEERYSKTFVGADNMPPEIFVNAGYDSPDLKNIESDLGTIRKNSETRYFTDHKGRLIKKYRNITSIIK